MSGGRVLALNFDELGLDKAEWQAKVDSRTDKADQDGCWLWTGTCRRKRGRITYGYIKYERPRIDGRRRRSHLQVHRLAVWLGGRALPVDKLVCHTCNNRVCVRGDHLYVGTHRQNMDDVIKSGGRKGVNHHNARLGPDDVVRIREGYVAGRTLKSLADEYEYPSVWCIVSGRIWTHVGGPIQKPRPKADPKVEESTS